MFDESLCFIDQTSRIPSNSNNYIQIVISRVEKFTKTYCNVFEKIYNPDNEDMHQMISKMTISQSEINKMDKITVTSFELAYNDDFRKLYIELIKKSCESNKTLTLNEIYKNVK